LAGVDVRLLLSKEWKKKYKDVPCLCKLAGIEEVRKNNYVLYPWWLNKLQGSEGGQRKMVSIKD
jgi:hypothetical protein